MTGKLFVGTSGFAYKEWKGHFYPEDLDGLSAAGRRQLRQETTQWERYAAGVAAVLATKPRPA